MEEQHYIIVKGWKNVQRYLGSQIGEMETRSLGIKKSKENVKGRGNMKVYYIPYKALASRLLKNQRKIRAYEESVALIRERLKVDPVLRRYFEEVLEQKD